MDGYSTLNELISKLFEPERRRLNLVIRDLNVSNKRLKALKTDGFLYGGKFYMALNVSATIPSAGQAKPTLDFSLNGEMEQHLKDCKIIADDSAMIKQILWKLLKPCNREADIRNALPECLVPIIPSLKAHPRYTFAGYTIFEDVRAWRQFQKYLPKMELYSITRLLY